MRKNPSPTMVALMQILRNSESSKSSLYTIDQSQGKFIRTKTNETTDKLKQDFYVAASHLWSKCTAHEWYLIGRIASELKLYNCLWHCEPDSKNNSSNRKAIAGLIKLDVIHKTETTNIYYVNPLYIRRGEYFTVLNTTIDLLMNSSKVTTDHLISRSPINRLDTSADLLEITD